MRRLEPSTSTGALARQELHMNYLISCSCGHTLEQHGIHDGCGRCACPRNRLAGVEMIELFAHEVTNAFSYSGTRR
jgi:hypothetical protein